MSSTPDRVLDGTKLEQVFADDGLDWIVERIRQRLERGAGLSGAISQRDPTPEQRAAYARLFGIPAPSARMLSVQLAELAALLRNAGICDDLGAAIAHLVGPVRCGSARHSGRTDRVRRGPARDSRPPPPDSARCCRSRVAVSRRLRLARADDRQFRHA